MAGGMRRSERGQFSKKRDLAPETDRSGLLSSSETRQGVLSRSELLIVANFGTTHSLRTCKIMVLGTQQLCD